MGKYLDVADGVMVVKEADDAEDQVAAALREVADALRGLRAALDDQEMIRAGFPARTSSQHDELA